jgi:hypothetical protein
MERMRRITNISIDLVALGITDMMGADAARVLAAPSRDLLKSFRECGGELVGRELVPSLTIGSTAISMVRRHPRVQFLVGEA